MLGDRLGRARLPVTDSELARNNWLEYLYIDPWAKGFYVSLLHKSPLPSAFLVDDSPT